MKIAIVIPVYNEGKRAVNTVKEILKVDRSSIIILVDDGSNDNSNEYKASIFLLYNLGKVNLLKNQEHLWEDKTSRFYLSTTLYLEKNILTTFNFCINVTIK